MSIARQVYVLYANHDPSSFRIARTIGPHDVRADSAKCPPPPHLGPAGQRAFTWATSELRARGHTGAFKPFVELAPSLNHKAVAIRIGPLLDGDARERVARKFLVEGA